MICVLASNTCMPAYGGTCGVELAARVRPASTTSMPAASVTTLSSSPNAGAMCTMPGAVLGGDVVGGEHLVRVRPLPAKKSNGGV